MLYSMHVKAGMIIECHRGVNSSVVVFETLDVKNFKLDVKGHFINENRSCVLCLG